MFTRFALLFFSLLDLLQDIEDLWETSAVLPGRPEECVDCEALHRLRRLARIFGAASDELRNTQLIGYRSALFSVFEKCEDFMQTLLKTLDV